MWLKGIVLTILNYIQIPMYFFLMNIAYEYSHIVYILSNKF